MNFYKKKNKKIILIYERDAKFLCNFYLFYSNFNYFIRNLTVFFFQFLVQTFYHSQYYAFGFSSSFFFFFIVLILDGISALR